MCLTDPNDEKFNPISPFIILLVTIIIFLVGLILGIHLGRDIGIKEEKKLWQEKYQEQIDKLYKTNKTIPRNTYKIPSPVKAH